MAPDERSRVEASQALSEQLGPAAAAALMECIPPYGWHEIATKRDLNELERRIDLRFDALEARFLAIDGRFAAIDSQFDAIEARFEGRFAGIDGRLVGIEGRLAAAVHAEATRMIKWTVGTIFGAIAAVCMAATLIAALLG